ncbi:MAG: FAD-dependent oxidoreductase [Desulfobacterales bacterium]|nr:FAD-dependent oxidoreductase [Desulfobacterales bacterium]
MDNKEPVLVIGAGPAGLAAAFQCTRRSRRVRVLEAADRVGGISRTEEYKGYLFDIGGHRFFTKIKRIDRLWREMLGNDFIRVARMSRIYYQGRFFNYPLECANALINLGLIESVLIVLSYLRAQLKTRGEEDTFEQWVCNRFGRRLYATFFKTYTEKVWGIPCHEIRADWAAQRIKGLSLTVALANALFGGRNTKSLIDAFDYPVRGPGLMWQRFQEAIEAADGEVRLNTEVVRLEHDQGRVGMVVSRCQGKTRRFSVEQVISSIPVTRLVQLLDPPPPEPVLAAARGLSYRAFLIVCLIVDRADLFPDQWIYVHSSEVRVGRIQNFKNWSAAMVPDPGTTSVGMEYFCNQGDDTWDMADNDLIRLAAAELGFLGLAEPGEVVDGCVIRQPGAYPVYDRDYRQHLAVIRQYLAGFANLQTVGRNGTHRYNNMDHSMQSGLLAAENLEGAGHDLWVVDEDDEYLEQEQRPDRPESDSIRLLNLTFARMDKVAIASAVGTVCGLLVFTATIWIISRGGDPTGSHLRLLSQYFIGYTVSMQGAFIAFAYTFFWTFLFAWLFAYIRNFILALYLFHIRKKTELLTLKDFFDHL